MSQIWRGNEMGQVQAGDRVFPGQGFMKIVNTQVDAGRRVGQPGGEQ